MIGSLQSRLIAKVEDESAQVLPWMALLIVLFLGAGGLCIDLGHAYICQRQLQASTDAAALAGGYALSLPGATTSTVTTAAKAYSSLSTGANATPSLPSVSFSPIVFKCLTSIGLPCAAAAGTYNAIQVTQTTTIPTLFIEMLKLLRANPMTSMTISTTATASMRGSTNSQYNVALVIDTTRSMQDTDSDGQNCSTARITCALNGAQVLLQSLTPCASATGTCAAFDSVSIFTYPNVDPTSASNDYTCTTSKKGVVSEGTPNIQPYATPSSTATSYAPTGSTPTYQIVGFSNDYSSTNAAGGALSTTSNLAIAVGASGKSGCPGMQAIGGEGTYFAGAVYAALAALNAQQVANPGSLNALIILSDGDADALSGQISATDNYSLTSNGTYPSLVNQCQQAITAAKTASSTTTVYTIAYGASTTGSGSRNGGCASDTSGSLAGVSPCTTLQDMASSAQTFYSDGGSGGCASAAAIPLASIFSTIATNFTVPRLLPNNTT